MIGHNIPKTKKNTVSKQPQSPQSCPKTSSKKSLAKKQPSTIHTNTTASTLTKSSSKIKLGKSNKKPNPKEKENFRCTQPYGEKSPQKSKSKDKQYPRTRNPATTKPTKSKKRCIKTQGNQIDYDEQPVFRKYIDKNNYLQGTEQDLVVGDRQAQGFRDLEEELTQRKKMHMGYFVKNDGHAEVGSAKKIVFKIQLVDQKERRYSKHRKGTEYEKCQDIRKSATELGRTDFVLKKKDTWTQNTDRKPLISDISCQTQPIQDPPIPQTPFPTPLSSPAPAFLAYQQSSQQSPLPTEKQLAKALCQLEQLNLAQITQLTKLSKSEKAHYKSVLLFMASKLDQPTQQEDSAIIEALLHERYLKQRGMAASFPKKGIPTHAPTIISYVSNLFYFLQVYQKSQFLNRINTSYGYPLHQKLRRIRTNKTIKTNGNLLISKATFQKFEAELHQGLHFDDQIIQQSLHVHNLAIFDAVNQALIQFQPYYGSQGQPFPWSYNFQTTFYYLSQNNFGALACQIKDKIWSHCSTIAGILLEEDYDGIPEARLRKVLSIEQQMIKDDMKNYTNKVEIDEERTKALLDVADDVELDILAQFLLWMIAR